MAAAIAAACSWMRSSWVRASSHSTFSREGRRGRSSRQRLPGEGQRSGGTGTRGRPGRGQAVCLDDSVIVFADAVPGRLQPTMCACRGRGPSCACRAPVADEPHGRPYSRSRSTSAPAGSGPEPCGAIAKPSLSPSAPVMCEPWRSVGQATSTPSSSGTSLEIRNVVRLSDGPAGSPSRPRSKRGPGVGLAAQPPQRGDDEDRRADDRATAGCPAARRPACAAAAEPQRLAGLDAHAPEDLLDAAGLERGLDVVVRADGHAAGHDQDVGLQPGLDRRAGRLEVVGDRRVLIDVGARGRARARSPPASWTRRSCPARAARPAAATRSR